ncbi:MAG TPA: PepSY domain-containing protein [Casimicrobiaceae bacterium]|jgi:vanillate O-demethylase ferredoxin subunit
MPSEGAVANDLVAGPELQSRARANANGRARIAFRTLVLQAHRWTGLTFGLVLLFVAITGILVAYRPHLEPIVNRDLLTVAACSERVSMDTIASSARAAHPGGELDYIRLTAAEEGAVRIPTVQVRIAEPGEYQHDVFVNPCTGDVLGQRDRYGGWLATIEQLHRFRFVEGGSLITGINALLFGIVLLGGGLYMWWPRRARALRAAAAFDPRLTGRHRTINRHKVIGLYVGLFVLSSALTGLPLAFDWYRDGVYALAGSKPYKPPQVAVPGAQTPLPMETYWRHVQSLVPNPGETLIHFPTPRKPKESLDIFTVTTDAPHAFARTMIYIDPYTDTVVKFVPYAEASAGHKLYFWMLSWHMGQVGGKTGNLLFPVVLMFGALGIPFLAYTGISSYVRRKFRSTPESARLSVQVVGKRVEATDICTFELADPLGNPLPSFGAGSHIDVHIGDGLVRQYSLCNDPRDTQRYLIGVLRVADSRGGSAAMHEQVHEGDVLEISEPRNHFRLAHGAKRSLLIAGGIGVTPILCMAERLANIGAEFEMHYCTRAEQRTAFLKRIRESSFADRVHFHFNDGPVDQKFDVEKVIAAAAPDTHLYVCGPKGFMDQVLATARRRRWPEQALHREYFASQAQASPNDVEFDVRLASTGRVYRIPKDQTVVAALTAQGIDIPTSCGQGVCGTCLTRVIDGDPDHRDLYQTDAERARNDQFTPCCSRARSPVLVLDL